MLLTALKVKLAALVAVAGIDTAKLEPSSEKVEVALTALEAKQKDEKADKNKAFEDAVKAIGEAAKDGDASAKFVLAHWMTFGVLQGASADQVMALYKEAADKGQLQAMGEYGALLIRSAQDQAKAQEGVSLVKQASDKGEWGAMRNYAQLLLRGVEAKEGKADTKGSETLLAKASAAGDGESSLMLSQMYQAGLEGVPKDESKALEMLKKAIQQGNAAAMSVMATRLFNGDQSASGGTPLVSKDPKAAVEMFVKAADNGNAAANRLLGQIYESGQGIEKADPKKAFEYYGKAAQGGDAGALLRLGQAFEGGVGIPGDKDADGKTKVEVLVAPDAKRALDFYRMAAQAGVPQALYAVGVFYETGTVVDKDLQKAFALLKRAADQGIPDAQFRVANLYQNGGGVQQDLVAAAGWFERAAQSGHAGAQLALGSLYENGYNSGVSGSNNMVQAANNYTAAAEQGSADAMFRLAAMYERGAASLKNEPMMDRALAYLMLAEAVSKDARLPDMIGKIREKMKKDEIDSAQRFFDEKKKSLEERAKGAGAGAAAAAEPAAGAAPAGSKGSAKGKGKGKDN